MRTFLTKIDEEIIYDSDRAMSKYILGMAYLTGTYKDKDCRKADLWFNEACKTGLKHGCECSVAPTVDNPFPLCQFPYPS